MTLPSFWQLSDFGSKIDQWATDQAPSDELIGVVVRWVFSRYDEPYQGLERVPDFPNYWWGPIPGTIHDGSVVCCYCWIYEMDRRVRCDNIASLSLPL